MLNPFRLVVHKHDDPRVTPCKVSQQAWVVLSSVPIVRYIEVRIPPGLTIQVLLR